MHNSENGPNQIRIASEVYSELDYYDFHDNWNWSFVGPDIGFIVVNRPFQLEPNFVDTASFALPDDYTKGKMF